MGSSGSKSKGGCLAAPASSDGASASSRVTEVDRQVLGLKTQRRKLRAYAKRVEEAIARETATAAAAAKTPGGRSRALTALRKRKLQTQMGDRVQDWLLRLETMLADIEHAQATAEVLERLRDGNEALKRAQAGYSLDDVNAVLRDMDEAKEHDAEVNELLRAGLSAREDEEAEAELAALEREAEAEVEAEATRAARGREVAGEGEGETPERVAEEMPDAPVEEMPDMPDVPKGRAEGEEEEAREPTKTRRALMEAA
jgi:charged multivesicular body protein 6